MIGEQELIDFMMETAYKPMTYQELEKEFAIEGAQEFKQFLQLLTKLENEGTIIRTRTERYGIPERMDLLRGKLQAHAKGFGFLIPENPDQTDVYINANDMKGAMNGDKILVRITNRSAAGGKLEGEVVRIVSRAVTRIVGTFQGFETYGFVLPDDKRINRDIFIPKNAFQGAADGQKVVVNIVHYPEGRAAAEGEIVEILGHKNDPGVDILSIIRKHGLPEGFPDEVMAEAEAAPDSISDAEIVQQGRRDLRHKTIVTIDGEDAKDLDDAVNVERLPNGNLQLGVHIADVGYYVKEGSALDREAYNRGCSVYLVDRVIPMIPHRLSNGICSLNPKVDRLTLSCEMEFDERGKVIKHDIFTSVIRTTERMTYTNVRKILTGDAEPELLEKYDHLLDFFKLMEELAALLRQKRMKRGAIDFDFQESKVIVDENGKPVDIIKRERSVAEMMIEEFMLAANETVAEHFHWLKVPFLYRIHEDPDQEKLLNFAQFITNFGYAVRGKGNSIHPRALQSILEEIKGSKEETVISTVMLRSMKQAKYDAESLGHFGLAAEFYSHFTSPIRRYPDLVIHRIIREVITGGGQLSEQRHEYLAGRMPDIAQQSSERERVAVDAERDTDQLKKAEFMLDKVGEEFEGIISSVTGFGMFIELPNTVEGLIRLSDLHDDYYHFHEQQLALIGERTSKIYRIGDDVKIRVARVNMDEHTIDFELVDMKPRRAGDNRGFGSRQGGRPGGNRGGGRNERDGGGRGRKVAGAAGGRGGEVGVGASRDGRGKKGNSGGLLALGERNGKKGKGVNGGGRTGNSGMWSAGDGKGNNGNNGGVVGGGDAQRGQGQAGAGSQGRGGKRKQGSRTISGAGRGSWGGSEFESAAKGGQELWRAEGNNGFESGLVGDFEGRNKGTSEGHGAGGNAKGSEGRGTGGFESGGAEGNAKGSEGQGVGRFAGNNVGGNFESGGAEGAGWLDSEVSTKRGRKVRGAAERNEGQGSGGLESGGVEGGGLARFRGEHEARTEGARRS